MIILLIFISFSLIGESKFAYHNPETDTLEEGTVCSFELAKGSFFSDSFPLYTWDDIFLKNTSIDHPHYIFVNYTFFVYRQTVNWHFIFSPEVENLDKNITLGIIIISSRGNPGDRVLLAQLPDNYKEYDIPPIAEMSYLDHNKLEGLVQRVESVNSNYRLNISLEMDENIWLKLRGWPFWIGFVLPFLVAYLVCHIYAMMKLYSYWKEGSFEFSVALVCLFIEAFNNILRIALTIYDPIPILANPGFFWRTPYVKSNVIEIVASITLCFSLTAAIMLIFAWNDALLAIQTRSKKRHAFLNKFKYPAIITLVVLFIFYWITVFFIENSVSVIIAGVLSFLVALCYIPTGARILCIIGNSAKKITINMIVSSTATGLIPFCYLLIVGLYRSSFYVLISIWWILNALLVVQSFTQIMVFGVKKSRPSTSGTGNKSNPTNSISERSGVSVY